MSGHSWGWLCGVVMNPKAVHSVQLACFLCCISTKRKYTLYAGAHLAKHLLVVVDHVGTKNLTARLAHLLQIE